MLVFLLMSTLLIELSSAANDRNLNNENADLISTVGAATSSKSDYICQSNSSFAWCIPPDYSNRKEPWRYKELINATFPWIYKFKFHIFDVEEISDQRQTIRLSMYFTIKWLEPRIIINQEAGDWNDTKYGLPDTVNIAPEILKNLWSPDLEIYGMDSFASQKILKSMSSLKIIKDRYVEYMSRVDISVSCQMNFDAYPLDSHMCPFRISSFYSAEETVTCTEELQYDKERQRSLQYIIDMALLEQEQKRFVYESKAYAVCGFSISLYRTRKQIFFQVYLTSILFVSVSWISFIIKPEVVPGRMALLVTTLLVLINIFNGVKSNAPTSTSLNAIDLYLVFCIGSVFLALVEYSMVLYNEKSKESSKKQPPLVPSALHHDNSSSKVIQAWPEKHPSRNKLDCTSLILFPLLFITFNVIYYVTHL